ncbi:MAG: GNAT family N-acetyltransferase [Acetatifactor sp.]|nr:GNAT family N-acetyltransferase [Acetatifactor sp.]MDE7353528.1 GNAT family N-acetyltransferase [Acetatifactor sp.]
MEIVDYTREMITDVMDFERRLRAEEPFYNWDIDEAYQKRMEASFDDPRFTNAISLLAYENDKVVGRIDGSIIASRFDGLINGYLDWICVIKSSRHAGIAQALLAELRCRMKQAGAVQLIALMAANEEAQRFYRAVEGAGIHDEGIWIEL